MASSPTLLLSSLNLAQSASLSESTKLDNALFALASDHHHKSTQTHFADILGQTLAGPLFATWAPTAVIMPTAKAAAPSSTVTTLDSNGRRDGRKRSRR